MSYCLKCYKPADLCFCEIKVPLSKYTHKIRVHQLEMLLQKTHAQDGEMKHITKIATCKDCSFPVDMCACLCPYCEKRDECECVLFDAVTGG